MARELCGDGNAQKDCVILSTNFECATSLIFMNKPFN